MRFQYDHDLHIHSGLSLCSKDPEQNKENILRYAEEKGLHTICITDHFWDEKVDVERIPWYFNQNYPHISQILPLPKSDKVRYLFGCETELSKDMVLGLSKERYDLFDFIVVPTTHLRCEPLTISKEEGASAVRRGQLWSERLDAVLSMDLPFHKVGIAHLLCGLMANPDELLQTMQNISLLEAERLFKKAANFGVGIEINADDVKHFEDETKEISLKIYQIAKESGCKFYLGSDAHHLRDFETCDERFAKAIDLLDLTEEDKYFGY
ncbi:MAG: PHP domain-containing protein [Clostridia bacterium]|nr:PHP domain-containing protein [Clostridia bacterium]